MSILKVQKCIWIKEIVYNNRCVKMKLFMLPLLLAVAVLVSGCAGQRSAQTAPDKPTAAITPTGEVKEFTIRESNFKLSPSNITVNQGDLIKITVVIDQGTHNLFVEGYDQRVNVASSGKSQVMEFVADKSGIFKMWCEVAGHRDLGMEGQLIVQKR